MRKLSIRIWKNSNIYYNHYFSAEFIRKGISNYYFKRAYPLGYPSRRFDKPAEIFKDGSCCWWIDYKRHRSRRPACIYPDGSVSYWENGKRIK